MDALREFFTPTLYWAVLVPVSIAFALASIARFVRGRREGGDFTVAPYVLWTGLSAFVTVVGSTLTLWYTLLPWLAIATAGAFSLVIAAKVGASAISNGYKATFADVTVRFLAPMAAIVAYFGVFIRVIQS
jgi:thiamine transporter ThiT